MEWKVSFTPNDLLDMTHRQAAHKVNPKVVLEVRLGKGFASVGKDIIVEDISFSGTMRIKLKLINNFPHGEYRAGKKAVISPDAGSTRCSPNGRPLVHATAGVRFRAQARRLRRFAHPRPAAVHPEPSARLARPDDVRPEHVHTRPRAVALGRSGRYGSRSLGRHGSQWARAERYEAWRRESRPLHLVQHQWPRRTRADLDQAQHVRSTLPPSPAIGSSAC